MNEQELYDEMEAERVRRRLEVAQKRSDALVPEAYGNVTPRPSQREAIKALTAWSKEPVDGIYLYGPPLGGKTLLAARTALRMREAGLPALFIKSKRALDIMRDFDTPHPNGYGTMSAYWLEVLLTVPYLILDDLGAHRTTDFALEQMTTVFDHRRDFHMPTLVTSNLSPDDLREKFDHRLAARVKQLCAPIFVRT